MNKIAIITGGDGPERGVSLRSTAHVKSLLEKYYDVQVFDFYTDTYRFLESAKSFDVVIPLIHGRGGEDGSLQGFLETVHIPYLFSGVEACALTLDKARAKLVVAAAGINTPHSLLVRADSKLVYKHPVVVKPVNGGSSVATAIIRAQTELEVAVMEALQHSEQVLVEDYIEGQEFTVAVIGQGDTATALPVIMISPKQGFFDYASKYDIQVLAEELCPAPISEAMTRQLQELAVRAHAALGCRQVSRTDIMVDKEGIAWFLETNSIPGMTQTSLLPKAYQATGRQFSELLRNWIEYTKNRPV